MMDPLQLLLLSLDVSLCLFSLEPPFISRTQPFLGIREWCFGWMLATTCSSDALRTHSLCAKLLQQGLDMSLLAWRWCPCLPFTAEARRSAVTVGFCLGGARGYHFHLPLQVMFRRRENRPDPQALWRKDFLFWASPPEIGKASIVLISPVLAIPKPSGRKSLSRWQCWECGKFFAGVRCWRIAAEAVPGVRLDEQADAATDAPRLNMSQPCSLGFPI